MIEQARQHEKEVDKQKKTPYEDVEKALYKKRDTINAEMDNIKGRILNSLPSPVV